MKLFFLPPKTTPWVSAFPTKLPAAAGLLLALFLSVCAVSQGIAQAEKLDASTFVASYCKKGQLAEGTGQIMELLDKKPPELAEFLTHLAESTAKGSIIERRCSIWLFAVAKGENAAPVLLKMLNDPEPKIRNEAVFALANMLSPHVAKELHAYAAKELPALVAGLSSDVAENRTNALIGIRSLLLYARPAAKDLAAYLEKHGAAVWNDSALQIQDLEVELEANNNGLRENDLLSLQQAMALKEPLLPHLIYLLDNDLGIQVVKRILSESSPREARLTVARLLVGIPASSEDIKFDPLILPLINDSDLEIRTVATSRLLYSNLPGAREAVSEYAKRSLPELTTALRSKDLAVRRAAAAAFAALGSEIAAAAPELVEALEEPDSEVQRGVARALNSWCKIPPQSVAAVVRVINSSTTDPEVQTELVHVLAFAGTAESTADLLLLLEDRGKAEQVRSNAAQELGNLGVEAATAISSLIKVLDDPSEDIRGNAAEALGRVAWNNPVALAALVAHANDKSATVQAKLFKAFDEMGTPAALAQRKKIAAARVPSLIQDLRPDNLDVVWSINALESLGVDASSAAGPLLDFARKNPDHEGDVLTALRNIDPQGQGLRELAMKQLKNPSQTWFQSTALEILEAQGENASPAVSLVAPLISDKDDYVRYTAVTILGAVKTPEAIKTIRGYAEKNLTRLLAEFKTASREAQGDIAEEIGRLGPAAEPAVGDLLKLLSGGKDWAALQAAIALKRIGTAEVNAPLQAFSEHDLLSVIRAIADKGEQDRYQVLSRTADLGALAAPAIAYLREATQDNDWITRQIAREALAKLKITDAPETGPVATRA